MKTTATQKSYYSSLQAKEPEKGSVEKRKLCIVYKSDLNNHRFAQHDNKTVQDAASWDQSWFAHYE